MDSFIRQTQHALLKKAALCLVFIALLAIRTQAQGILAPIVTAPIVSPSVLSSGGSVTNGGVLVITATVTTTLTLKSLTWYCGSQPVPASKSNTLNILGLLGVTVSTLTITNLESTNAGSYTLHAKNDFGTTISAPVIVVVSNLANTVVTTVTNVVDFVSAETGMSTNGFKIKLSGPTGSNVVVQASSDLIHWTPISTNTISGGNTSFTDTTAKSRPGRYYRAYIQ
jgi:hypothetical protein